MDRSTYSPNRAFRYLDVCAGISASTVAWKPLGWEAAAYSEIEPAPREVLTHHYPDTPLHGDFTTIKGDEYGAIDLLVGGTPCQDFSVAGLRAGLDGDRGNLSLEFLRLADRTRPRWVVWENVPGVLSIDGGRAFGAILGGLGELGYGFAYRVLDAVHFGSASFRRRVFVVANSGSWRNAAAALLERESMSGRSSSVRGQLRGRGKDRLGCLSAKAIALDRQDLDLLIYDYHAQTVRFPTVLEFERAMGFPDDYTDITKESCFARAPSGAQSDDPLRHNAGRLPRASGEAERALRTVRGRNEAARGGSLPSERDGPGHPMSPVQHQTADSRGHGLGDVGLGISGKRRGLADGPRYKALGNSMAVPVMRWIGERIQMVEAIHAERVAA